MVMSETMPLAQVKAHLSEVVDRVTRSHERVAITRHGRREAVVIAADDLDAL
jgi:antitoxin YefM